jgi:hypothetical protein
MEDIETQLVLLQWLHAALSKVKDMGGPGILLPGHANEALEELEMAQECYQQLQQEIGELGQRITAEQNRIRRDMQTFRKFER